MAEPTKIGGVSVGEMKSLWEERGTPPEEAGASPAARFCRAVSVLVAKRVGRSEDARFAALLMSESIGTDAAACTCTHVPLLENGADQLTGNIWLTTPKLAAAYRVNVGWTSQEELFTAIDQVGFSALPAIIVDWRSGVPLVKLFPRGLATPDERETVIIEDRPITDVEIKESLDRFFHKSLRNPLVSSEGHATKIWLDARKGIPAFKPEERIQGRLLDALRVRFSRHDLRAEPITDEGRADIVMWLRVLSAQGHPALRYDWVLELKALCDRTSSGGAVPENKVRAAIVSGVEQVLAYRDQLSANRAALCCYDMRSQDEGDDACFRDVAEPARISSIALWRWFLLRSAQASRSARYRVIAE